MTSIAPALTLTVTVTVTPDLDLDLYRVSVIPADAATWEHFDAMGLRPFGYDTLYAALSGDDLDHCLQASGLQWRTGRTESLPCTTATMTDHCTVTSHAV